MVDRLRLLWNRPLRDSDRRRLFAIAVALIAAAAAVLTQLERPGTSPSAQNGRPAPVSPVPEAMPTPAASAPQAPPSEEGTRTPVAAARAEVAATKQAARGFLARYLPYTYGHARARQIRPATAALRRRLAAERPRVPVRERRRAPRLVLLQSNTVGHRHAALTALIDDGRRRYTVALELAHTRAGWQVDRVGS